MSESVGSIRARLNIPAHLDKGDDSFFADSAKRNEMRYLDKAFQSDGRVTVKATNDTSLLRIASAMDMSPDEVHFEPALDHTFGNAIIGRKAHGE